MIYVPKRSIIAPRRHPVRAPRRRQAGFIINPYEFGVAFRVDAAEFDGTNDYLSGTMGAQAEPALTVSFWFRLDGVNAAALSILDGGYFSSSSSRLRIMRDSSNKMTLQAFNSSGSIVALATSTSTYTQSSTWHHCAISFDLANAAHKFMYVDGVSVGSFTTFTTGQTVDLATHIAWYIGAQNSGAAAGFRYNGPLAELWIAGMYFDLSTKLGLFRNSVTGKPVDLGVGNNGTTPCASADANPNGYGSPFLFFHLDHGETANDFALDRSPNFDNFTVNGALTTGSTSPTD